METCHFCQRTLDAGTTFCRYCGRSQPNKISGAPRTATMLPGTLIQPCPACGEHLPAIARFCRRCGYQQPKVAGHLIGALPLFPARSSWQCPACGGEQHPGTRFCRDCGRPSRQEEQLRGATLEAMDWHETKEDSEVLVPLAPVGPQAGTPNVPIGSGVPQTGMPNVPTVPGMPQTGMPSVPSAPGGPQTGAPNQPSTSGGPQTGKEPAPGGYPTSGPRPTSPGSGQSPIVVKKLPHRRRSGCLPRVIVLVLLVLILIPTGIFAYLIVHASSKLQVHPGSFSQTCTGNAPLPPLSAMLDNRANGTSIDWRVSLKDSDPAGQRWASISPSSGTIPAGGSATLTITPAVSLCQDIAISLAPLRFTATLSYLKESVLLTDTVTPPPVIKFDAAPALSSQMCNDTQALPALTVTLDNTKSNLPIEWQVRLTDTDPAGKTWAAATPTSGRVAGAQNAELTLTPAATLCSDMMKSLAPVGYTAVLTYTAQGKQGTVTVTDTIAPPVVVNLQSSLTMTSQTCHLIQPLPAVPVMLENTGNISIDWQASVAEKDPAGSVWATASPASGSLSPGQQASLTLTINPALCADLLGGSAVTYHATISYTASGKTQEIILADTITPPPAVNDLQITPQTAKQSCTSISANLAPIPVTLDNSQSTVPVGWQASVNGGDPAEVAWAVASPTTGEVPAGQKATLTITPGAKLCAHLTPGSQATAFYATISDTALGKTTNVTFTDTVTPAPPVVNFTASPQTVKQNCNSTNDSYYLPSIAITLNNNGSNVSVQWQVSSIQMDPAGRLWATASSTSGTVGAGLTSSLTIYPFYVNANTNLCHDMKISYQDTQPSPVPFTVVISYRASSGQSGSITITYNIIPIWFVPPR